MTVARATRCRRCRAPVAAAANFCGECGAAFDRPNEAWQRFKPLLGLFVALLGINLALGLVVRMSGGDATVTLICESGAQAISLLVVAAAAWREREALRPLLQSHGFHGRDALLVPALLLLLFAFWAAYSWACEWLHVPFVRYIDDYREAGWPIWTAFVAIAVVPPVCEEVAFRGVILGGLQRFMRPVDALLLQAAMFSVLHLSPIIFVSHFVIGLALGWVRVRTQRLLPCIALHAAWNGWVLIEELLGR